MTDHSDTRARILDQDARGLWPTGHRARTEGWTGSDIIFRAMRSHLRILGVLKTSCKTSKENDECIPNLHPQKGEIKPRLQPEPKAPWLPAWAIGLDEQALYRMRFEIESVRLYRAAWRHVHKREA